jgi:hypothetical protein
MDYSKPTVGLINSSARIIENSDSRRVLKQHRPIVSAEFTGMASKRGDFYRLGLCRRRKQNENPQHTHEQPHV